MRPSKQFFGLTLEGFQAGVQAVPGRRGMRSRSSKRRWRMRVSKRTAAEAVLLEILQGVVLSVKGDPAEGQNGELIGAMGYVPKNQRSSGLVRPRKMTRLLPE